MFEAIEVAEYGVKDGRTNLVVLDVEAGAQLFNMFAAMSDERFGEGVDDSATWASDTQLERVFGTANGLSTPDETLQSMDTRLAQSDVGGHGQGGMSSTVAMIGTRVNGSQQASRDASTNPSGEEGREVLYAVGSDRRTTHQGVTPCTGAMLLTVFRVTWTWEDAS